MIAHKRLICTKFTINSTYISSDALFAAARQKYSNSLANARKIIKSSRLEKTFKIKFKFQLDLASPVSKACPLEPLWKKSRSQPEQATSPRERAVVSLETQVNCL